MIDVDENTVFATSYARLQQGFAWSSDVKKEVFLPILNAYAETTRHYHTLQHLEECLLLLQHVPEQQPYKKHIELALWFHDVVYDLHRSDNEARSAECLCEMLAPWLTDSFRQDDLNYVTEAVLATHHTTERNVLAFSTLQIQAMDYVVDIDLAILGQSAERFAMYEQQIRQEYAHVPWLEYVQARRRVLMHFLNQPCIYQTAVFQGLFQHQAQKNIQAALQQLLEKKEEGVGKR